MLPFPPLPWNTLILPEQTPAGGRGLVHVPIGKGGATLCLAPQASLHLPEHEPLIEVGQRQRGEAEAEQREDPVEILQIPGVAEEDLAHREQYDDRDA